MIYMIRHIRPKDADRLPAFMTDVDFVWNRDGNRLIVAWKFSVTDYER